MNDIDSLAKQLQPYYSLFDVADRLLFTGHSHQAWPDAARDGLLEAFDVTAGRVDNKWDAAEEKTDILRNYLRDYYDDAGGYYCRGESTHQLMVAWLSSLDIKNKPKIITTNREFHSMNRQLQRLSEEGMTVVKVDAESDHILAEIRESADNRTCAIMLSRVYFKSSLVNPHISGIARIARDNGIPLLIDDYHGTNVVPLSIADENLQDCFLITGGYKYLQWGEGNCFLRFPEGCELRPAVTGWFASFSTLESSQSPGPVPYDGGDQRFASSTYDPVSQFRAAKVVSFFREQGLTPRVLQSQYTAQIKRLRELFRESKYDPDVINLYHEKPLSQNGGFLALKTPFAQKLQSLLLEEDVLTDARGDVLRMGPAPYITTGQIDRAMGRLKACIGKIQS